MSIRSILSSEGLIKSANFSEMEAKFDAVLQDLMNEVELPRVRISGFKDQKVPVKVPMGFESMFKTITIELWCEKKTTAGLFATLSWRYTHPGGGYNGQTIGRLGVDAETLEASWRTETGAYKVV